ncbi:MAG: hypothetical protein KAH23_07125 [Kiritimatiellae bacterium]|nr:hypothetical protein [Kiritimatiellia bacterium]
MDFSRILNAGVEDLFGIFVFLAIVAVNIIKFVKKGSNAEQPRNIQGSPQESQQDELKAFLESLSGVQQPAPAAIPTPPPPPPVRPKQVTVARHKTPAATPQAVTTPVVLTTKPAPRSDVIVKKTANIQPNIIRNTIGADLTKNTSLRKAIVLREILGPPLALQSKC